MKRLFPYLFTADPAAHVFSDGRLWLYADRDPDRPNEWWGAMCDYHAFSTADLLNWTDHGTVLGCDDIAWCGGAAWDGDCVERGGKYWYFFPMIDQIGVAVSDSPAGPFRDALGHPLITRQTPGILPKNPSGGYLVSPVVVDSPQGIFLYFGQNEEFYGVELKESMVELAGPVRSLVHPEVYHEGPWVFYRAGRFHMIYGKGQIADVLEDQSDNLAYASADDPFGPFVYRNIVQADMGRTVQACLVEWKDKDIFFYHEDGPDNYHRYIRAEMVDRPADGGVELIPRGIAPLIPTSVRLDAGGCHLGEDYHESGGQVERLKPENARCGFARLAGEGVHIRFNSWSSRQPARAFKCVVRAMTGNPARLQIHSAGKQICFVEISGQGGGTDAWQEVVVPLLHPLDGEFEDLTFRPAGNSTVDVRSFTFI